LALNAREWSCGGESMGAVIGAPGGRRVDGREESPCPLA
jgi:hypothetical protein